MEKKKNAQWVLKNKVYSKESDSHTCNRRNISNNELE
jgi:hypothetical protein